MENNTSIKIIFEYFDEESQYKFVEALWANKVNNGYAIDSIPFYIKSVAIGDIFSVNNLDGEFIPNNLIEESGNSTIRLLFKQNSKVKRYRKELEKKMNVESELSNLANLVSLNVPLTIDYKTVIQYLDEGEKKQLWEYQEACISSIHRNQLT